MAQRELPPSLRPLPVGQISGARASDAADEDLDMVLGKVEDRMLDQYSEAMDDTARAILRRLTADYAEQVHDLASRLDTNLAEKRWRDRKRATTDNADDMEDVGDDGDGWQTAQGRRSTTSATRGRRAQDAAAADSPRRAGGGAGTPPAAAAEATGSLSHGGAAEPPGPGAAGHAGPPNRGEGCPCPNVISYRRQRSREGHPPKTTTNTLSLTELRW